MQGQRRREVKAMSYRSDPSERAPAQRPRGYISDGGWAALVITAFVMIGLGLTIVSSAWWLVVIGGLMLGVALILP